MSRKLLAILLAALLLISGTALAEVSFPLDEEITLTAFVIGMEGGVDFTSNYVNQWIKEKTNINLEFVGAVSGDEGKTKLNMMLYSGEKLPDIFLCTRWSKAECQLYGSEGLVIALNDYLKDAPTFNYLNEVCPSHYGDLMMNDGNIYSYGNVNECFHCVHQARMWIYQPWVDSLNDGKLPETTDELYDFLMKVKTMDPNGNGKNDEIPFTGYLDGWSTDPFVFISNAFLHNNNMISNTNPIIAGGFMIDEDGKVVYNMLSEDYRDALRYMNKLYKDGLLDSQTYTQTSDQCNATLEAEEHLCALMGGGAMPENTNFWSQSEGAWQNWTLLPPLKGPKGVQYAYTGLYGYFGSCNGLVSSDCEYPEIAVALFDLLATEEGTRVQGEGIQGLNWDWKDDGVGLAGGPSKWIKLIPDKRKEDGSVDYAAYGYDFVSATWDSDAQIASSIASLREGEAVEDPNMNVEAILYNCALIYDPYSYPIESIVPDMPYTEEQSKKIAEYTVSVGAYANSATIRFITGDMDIEKDWDGYLEEMKKQDVDGYIAVMQEAYDSYKANLDK